MYQTENWTVKVFGKTRTTAAKIKLMRTAAKYTWMGCKRKEDIHLKLKTEPIFDKILKYKSNWIQHVHRIQRDRLSKLLTI
jgi:hypothetical protein